MKKETMQVRNMNVNTMTYAVHEVKMEDTERRTGKRIPKRKGMQAPVKQIEAGTVFKNHLGFDNEIVFQYKPGQIGS